MEEGNIFGINFITFFNRLEAVDNGQTAICDTMAISG